MDEIVLAIMSDARFGMNDRGEVCLSFHVHDSEASGSFQMLNVRDAVQMLKDYQVGNVADLNGRPCWVKRRNGLMVYERPWRKNGN